jgi:hypothetical protein
MRKRSLLSLSGIILVYGNTLQIHLYATDGKLGAKGIRLNKVNLQCVCGYHDIYLMA